MSQQDTLLEKLDFCEVGEKLQGVSPGKRSQYVKYFDTDRFNIGKYAHENEPAATAQHFQENLLYWMKVPLEGFVKSIE